MPQASLVLIPLLGAMLPTTSVYGQVLSANDGTATIVNVASDTHSRGPGQQIDITGGQLSNDSTNLFQSFEQFDITAEQTANFITPATVQNVVGKISADNASHINGTLQVHGSDANLYLMNPAGILMGPEAQLNLSGDFTATTATGIGFEDGDFTASNNNYGKLNDTPQTFQFSSSQTGAVVNLGDLSVEEGQAINFIGGTVVNAGNLSAPDGTITMATVEGEHLVRISQGEQLLNLEVDAIGAASEGTTSLTADIRPPRISEMLTGGNSGGATAIMTNPDGSISLGSSTTSISEVEGSTTVSGSVSTTGETGGNINILGSQVSLIDANLEASGIDGGGLIRVGGDYQGKGRVINAVQTLVNERSTLSADAIAQGNGGSIIVWADETTNYSGHLSAQGSFAGGHGGFAEVSGKTNFTFDGSANLSATQGNFGTLLIDPANIEITDGAPSGTANTAYFTSTDIEDLFNGSNLALEATNNITIRDISNDDLEVNDGRSLRFAANSDGVNGGAFRMGLDDTIRAEQGDVTIAGSGITVGTIDTSTDEHNTGGASGIVGGNVVLTSSQDITATNIFTYGDYAGNHHAGDGGDVTIEASGGDINIEQSILTYSAVNGREAGNAGNITLTARNNINVSTATPTNDSVLLASSEAQTYDSGDGGNISLSALTGEINIAGNIATWSEARGSDDQSNSLAGNGGNVFLSANNNINTGDIITRSRANQDGAGNGGDVTINTTAGIVTGGSIESLSRAGRSSSGNAGDVSITANTIVTDMIEAWSRARLDNSGSGGSVTFSEVHPGNSSVYITGGIHTSSEASNNNSGNGGEVNITADSVTVTSTTPTSINSISTADENALDGGDITINARESLTVSGKLTSYSRATDADGAGDGGDVKLTANLIDIGIVRSGSRATSNAGNAGEIFITAGQSLIGQGMYADSTGGGNRADITLVGDRINIIQDETARLVGNNIRLQTASDFQTINIGGTERSDSGFDILESDLSTVLNSGSFEVGSTDANSIINLQPGIIENVGNRPVINILGGATVVGIENTDNTFQITELGQGELLNADVVFSNIENLFGGNQNDTFEFIGEGAIAGNVNGVSGNNTLDYSNYTSDIYLDGEAKTASGLQIFNNIRNIVGSSGNNDRIVGFGGDDVVEMTSNNSGNFNNNAITFSGMEVISGHSGNNVLSLTRLPPTGTTNTWIIDRLSGGTVNGLRFENFATLEGGIDNDTFRFIENGNFNGNIIGNGGIDTLDYGNTNNTPIEIDLDSMSATGLLGFSGIGHIIGSTSSSDLLLGSRENDLVAITGDGTGKINDTITFSAIERFNGNEGSDSLDYSGYATAVDVNLDNQSATGISKFSNIENIVGSNTNNDKIIGSTESDAFSITGNGTGNVNGTLNFSDIETIEGNAGDDTLSYSNYENTIAIDIENNSATGLTRFSEIETIIGSSHSNDQIKGSAENDIFTISGSGSGNVNETLAFTDIEQLDGSTGADTFTILTGGLIAGTVEGNEGLDTINYSAHSSALEIDFKTESATGIGGFQNIESVVGNNNTESAIEGSDNNDTFILTSDRSGILNGTLRFTDIGRINGQGGSNTIVTQSLNSENTNIWEINAANSGTVNNLAFQNIQNLNGSNSSDTFNFIEAGALTGAVQGGGGISTLDYSQYKNGAITINTGNLEATGVSGFSNINNLIGTREETDQLIGASEDNIFELSGRGMGQLRPGGQLNNALSFSEIERLNGGDGLNNRIVSSGAETTWEIDGTNQGTLLEGNTAIASFEKIQNLETIGTTSGETVALFSMPNAQITGSLNSGNNHLSLVGNDINIGDGIGDIQGATISGQGTLTIRPEDDSKEIVLGGLDRQNANALTITDGELAAIQDGFLSVLIGGGEQTGGIRLGGDARFSNSVALQSQANIDTRNGQLINENGTITLQTEGALFGGNITSNNQSVTLTAQQDIDVSAVVAGGGQGIVATSETGSVTVNDMLDSRGSLIGSNINITANNDINIGNLITTGEHLSGDVSLVSRSGSLATGGITTANSLDITSTGQQRSGSVTLNSPESIQVEFIDARGNNQNTEATSIDIETQNNLVVTGSINTPEASGPLTGSTELTGGASISTVGTEEGSIRIRYGNRDQSATPFQIGPPSNNGTQWRIETPRTAILSGEFLGDYTQENIELINRGILPTVVEPPTARTINFEVIELSETPALVSLSENGSKDIFTQIESSNSEAFGRYLGIEDSEQTTQIATLQEVQEALENIDVSTDTKPAAVYVYFVPDADSANAVGDWSDRIESPDDQLEVMLITQTGDPVRRRQWGVTRAQVEETNQTLRQQATSQFSTAQQYLPPAQQLYNWIINPIADVLKTQSINSLGFIMDTGLRTMPMATLHDGEDFLVENYSLGVLPSFSLGNINKTTTINRESFSETRVLAMGASQFQDHPDLPGVTAEINLIAEGLGGGDAFLNEDFILENLQKQIENEDYGVVHLATHAVFESGNLDNSYIQLWDEKLSLNQLGNLPLTKEDIGLIILSACNTALGDYEAEYGFAGLTVSTGSEAALATLWPVNDEGTLGFMTQFYTQLSNASVRTEALREAQLRLINGEVGIDNGKLYGPNDEILTTIPELAESGRWDFSHPFYWSSFTMIGNPW